MFRQHCSIKQNKLIKKLDYIYTPISSIATFITTLSYLPLLIEYHCSKRFKYFIDKGLELNSYFGIIK